MAYCKENYIFPSFRGDPVANSYRLNYQVNALHCLAKERTLWGDANNSLFLYNKLITVSIVTYISNRRDSVTRLMARVKIRRSKTGCLSSLSVNVKVILSIEYRRCTFSREHKYEPGVNLMRGSRKFCQTGSNFYNVFLVDKGGGGGGRIQIPL